MYSDTSEQTVHLLGFATNHFQDFKYIHTTQIHLLANKTMWPPTSHTGQPRVLETLVVKNATTHLCCIFRLQLWFSGDSITALLMLSCTVLLLLHISTVSLVPGFVSLSGTSCSKLGSLPTLLSGVFTEGVVML